MDDGSPVEIDRVPRLPKMGNSTMYPARRAPGTPITLRIACYSWENEVSDPIVEVSSAMTTHVSVSYIHRSVSKVCSARRKAGVKRDRSVCAVRKDVKGDGLVCDKGVVERECQSDEC